MRVANDDAAAVPLVRPSRKLNAANTAARRIRPSLDWLAVRRIAVTIAVVAAAGFYVWHDHYKRQQQEALQKQLDEEDYDFADPEILKSELFDAIRRGNSKERTQELRKMRRERAKLENAAAAFAYGAGEAPPELDVKGRRKHQRSNWVADDAKADGDAVTAKPINTQTASTSKAQHQQEKSFKHGGAKHANKHNNGESKANKHNNGESNKAKHNNGESKVYGPKDKHGYPRYEKESDFKYPADPEYRKRLIERLYETLKYKEDSEEMRALNHKWNQEMEELSRQIAGVKRVVIDPYEDEMSDVPWGERDYGVAE
jgi:hypothetical protein